MWFWCAAFVWRGNFSKFQKSQSDERSAVISQKSFNMKKLFFCLFTFSLLTVSLQAQKYFTRNGEIDFQSETPLEKIEAKNKSVTAVLDIESGRVEFAALIKAFEFEKALMQEHFNENYMESSQFPKAVFKGQLIDFDAKQLTRDGNYTATVSGELTIHGETRPVSTEARFHVKDGRVAAVTEFSVLVADYKIEIPAVVRDNIAKEVLINVKVDLEELKKG